MDHICVDLKMVGFIFGLQSDSKMSVLLVFVGQQGKRKKKHWTRKNWPLCNELIPSSLNAPAPPSMECSKIVFPPFQIKLSIMKKFVKAFEKDGDYFRYICIKFPGISIKKLKPGVFGRPPTQKLMNDAYFCNFLNPVELRARTPFSRFS